MLIQEALKETGKATKESHSSRHAEEVNGALCWRNNRMDEGLVVPVWLVDVLCDNWQPYHEVKEIRPEKAGELWKHEPSGQYYCIDYKDASKVGNLQIIGRYGGSDIDTVKFYGKDWIRLFSPGEESIKGRL